MIKITLYRNNVPEVAEFETIFLAMRHAFTAMELGSGFLTRVESDDELIWRWKEELSNKEALRDLRNFIVDYEDIRQEVVDEQFGS